MSTLETRNLTKMFGSLVVTDDVSLTFASGKRYAIIGPNGAGKTTYFNLLAGNLRPNAGKVILDGRDVTSLDVTSRAQIGIARSFQRNNLFTELSVQENLAIARAIKEGVSANFWQPMGRRRNLYERADAVAAQVGLSDDLHVEVRHLSYGGQRQLEMALALACDPKVLLLDEPTSGMSPEETARMEALINNLPRELSIIVIEHDMDIVLSFAEHIAVLDYGRVLAQGTPDEIRASDVVRERYLGETLQHGQEGA